MVGLIASASLLLEQRAAPNAQLRVVNLHLVPSVGTDLNLLTAAAALYKAEDAYTGTSAFGYSGTIAHAVLAAEHGSIPIDWPWPTRIRFRGRTFAWELPFHGAGAVQSTTHTPFLGVPSSSSSDAELQWEQQLAAHELVFLQDHRVGRVALLPGTCYTKLARAMVRVVHGDTAVTLGAVKFTTIMFLDDELDGAIGINAKLCVLNPLLAPQRQVIFDLQSPRDIFLVIATPGWITGQSYMIASPLCVGGVKADLRHIEPAAGLVGLLLALVKSSTRGAGLLYLRGGGPVNDSLRTAEV